MTKLEIIRRRERLQRLAKLHTLYHDKMRWSREYLEDLDNWRDCPEIYRANLQSAAYWRAEALADYARYRRTLARLTAAI